ncbi:LCP family protein [Actinomadura sp. LOL_016]|uniref:LCP family protein n=1 Tax=unclassified Actinomadura TaxID=2626254 RepID=UPI003A8105A0
MTDGHGTGRDDPFADGDADPLERYFRPRPAGGSDGRADGDDGDIDGVTIDGMPAPRVPVEGPRGPRRPGPRMSPRAAVSARRQRRLLTVTAGMSAFVLLTSGGAWAFQNYVTGAIDKISIDGLDEDAGGVEGPMTVLVAGVDRRDGLTKEQVKAAKLGRFPGERSDTMLLMHVSADRKRISVVSLPRDSYVTIPAHDSNGSEGAKGRSVPARPGKLTWAYQFGGASLAVKTVKRATGVSIDHYVEVNFYGFVKMVDSLGGVDVCVEEPVEDPKSGLRLPAGKSHVDGLKALAFARTRYSLTGGSDLGRIDRQQQFLAAMMKQALSTETLSNPVKSTKFLNAALDTLTVDDQLAKDLPEMADEMRDLSTDDLSFANVPLENPDHQATLWNAAAPQSTVKWDREQAQELFQKIENDKPLASPEPSPPKPSTSPTQKPEDGLTVPPEDVSVRVLNAIGTPGLATKAGRQLEEAGFETSVVPGLARRGLQTTEIRYGPAKAEAAKTLAKALPGAKLKEMDELQAEIQVYVGGDWGEVEEVTVESAEPTPTPTPSRSAAVETGTQKLCG